MNELARRMHPARWGVMIAAAVCVCRPMPAVAGDLGDPAAAATVSPGHVAELVWLLHEGAEDSLEPVVAVVPNDLDLPTLRYVIEGLRAAAPEKVAMLMHLVHSRGPRKIREEAGLAYADLIDKGVTGAADARRAAHRDRLFGWAADRAEDPTLRRHALSELAYFRDPRLARVVVAELGWGAEVPEEPLLYYAEALAWVTLLRGEDAVHAALAMTGSLTAFRDTRSTVESLIDARFPPERAPDAVRGYLTDPQARVGAALVLTRWDDRAALPVLTEALASFDKGKRLALEEEREVVVLLDALAGYDDHGALGTIASIASHLPTEAGVVAALHALAGADAAVLSEAVLLLDRALTDSGSTGRELAARLLSTSPTAGTLPSLEDALELALRNRESSAQRAILDALLATGDPGVFPLLADNLDRVGSVLDPAIEVALVSKLTPAARPAVVEILRRKALKWHPAAARVLGHVGSVDDLYTVFRKAGTKSRPLIVGGMAAHLRRDPASWRRWLDSTDAERRLFALVFADLVKDDAKAAAIAAHLTDSDDDVRRWALVRLQPFVGPDHAPALLALARSADLKERSLAMARLTGLSEPAATLGEACTSILASDGAASSRARLRTPTHRARHELVRAALVLCERAPHPSQRSELVALIGHKSVPVRRDVAALLAGRAEELSASDLVAVADALDREKTGDAALLWIDILETREAHRDAIFHAALHPDRRVSARGMAALGEHATARDWPLLVATRNAGLPGSVELTWRVWRRELTTHGGTHAAALLAPLPDGAALGLVRRAWPELPRPERVALAVAMADVSTLLRGAALQHLLVSGLVDDPKAIAMAREHTDAKDPAVRRAAVEVIRLGSGGLPEELARTLLRDREPFLRNRGFEALAALTSPGVSDLPDLARRALSDDDREMRTRGAEALASHGSSGADLLALAEARSEETDVAARVTLWNAAVAVADRLAARASDSRARDALLRVSRLADDPTVRRLALSRLTGATGPGAGADHLARLLRRDDDLKLRRKVLLMLEEADPAAAVVEATHLLGKRSEEHLHVEAATVLARRANDLGSLELLARAARTGRAPLLDARDELAARLVTAGVLEWEKTITSREPALRSLAVKRLAPDARHAGVLLRMAREDRSVEVRVQALRALHSFGRVEAATAAVYALTTRRHDDLVAVSINALNDLGGSIAALNALYDVPKKAGSSTYGALRAVSARVDARADWALEWNLGLRSKHAPVRRMAVDALTRRESPDADKDLLLALAASDRDLTVRTAALHALRKKAEPRLEEVAIDATSSRKLWSAATASLGDVGRSVDALDALARLADKKHATATPFARVAERIDAREDAAETWATALKSSRWPEVRVRAVRGLLAAGAVSRYSALVASAASDRNAELRGVALDALRESRDSETERLAIEAIDKRRAVTSAATTLGELGTEHALIALFRFLEDKKLAPYRSALLAAKSLIWGRVTPGPERLASWATDAGTPALLRYEAVKLLPAAALTSGGIGSDTLVRASRDRDELVRSVAFARVAADPTLVGGEATAVAMARAGLDDRRSSVVRASLSLLRRFGNADDLLPLDRLARDHGDGGVRSEARDALAVRLETLSAEDLASRIDELWSRAKTPLRLALLAKTGAADPAAPLVIKAAGDRDEEVRAAAFALLGSRTDGPALEAARRGLRDPDDRVARASASILGSAGGAADLARLADATDRARPSVRSDLLVELSRLEKRMAETLTSEAWSEAVGSAVDKRRDETALLLLRRVDASPKPMSPEVMAWHARKGRPTEARFLAIRVLGRIGGETPARELLRIARSGADEDIRVAALEAVGATGYVAATPELLELTGAKVTDRVRRAAFDASLKIRAAGTANPRLTVAALGEALSGGDDSVARFALDEMAKLALKEASVRPDVASHARTLLASPKGRGPEVRRAAVRVLEETAGRGALSDFLGLLDDPDGGVRDMASEAAFRLRDPSDVGPLRALLRAKEDGVRRRAIKILGGLGGDDAASALAEAARGDTSWENRLAAVDTLGSLEWSGRQDLLVDVSNDARSDVRLAAVRTLVAVLGEATEAPPKVVAALARRVSDSEPDLRREAIRALGRWGNASHAPAIRAIAEKDSDFAVRTEARRALERLEARAAKEGS